MNVEQYRFFKQLKNLPFVTAIWLFGSRARGDAKSRSDIDLAIVCPEAQEKDWKEVERIVHNADTLLKIDCVRLENLKNDAFKKNVLLHKKVLYKQKPKKPMETVPWKDYFKDLGSALNRLKEVLALKELEKSIFLKESAIQRFEFCIELYWKVLRKFLNYQKVDVSFPREVLEESYRHALIDDEKIWLAMLDDRNKMSHVYKMEEALRVYENIKKYYTVMAKTYKKLAKRMH